MERLRRKTTKIRRMQPEKRFAPTETNLVQSEKNLAPTECSLVQSEKKHLRLGSPSSAIADLPLVRARGPGTTFRPRESPRLFNDQRPAFHFSSNSGTLAFRQRPTPTGRSHPPSVSVSAVLPPQAHRYLLLGSLDFYGVSRKVNPQ